MKSNTFLKFLIMYSIIGVTGLLSIFFIGHKIAYDISYKNISNNLYINAINISKIYGNYIFEKDNLGTKENIKNVATINDYHILCVSINGDVVLDTKENLQDDKIYKISDFDATRFGSNHVWNGYFYNVFNEKTMSVFAPVTKDFSTQGYVVVNVKNRLIEKAANKMLFLPFVIYLIMYALSFIFLIYYRKKIHKPIRSIINVINEYKKGKLIFQKNLKPNNELEKLEIALSLMANKINDMESYQKEFLSNISHDFRSPLTSIKGYINAILDGTIDIKDAKKYLEIIIFETNRLTKLTENILTLNELDPKNLTLSYSSFDINDCIRHTTNAFIGICQKKNICFDVEFCDEKTFIYADKEKYQQVLYNLVDNAIKFSDDNKKIKIIVSYSEEKAVIQIIDNGFGISDEDINKIWNRLYKVDSSRGKNKKSSGLGLSIAKEIINAHKEDISVSSTVGVGTTFTFTATLSCEDDHSLKD